MGSVAPQFNVFEGFYNTINGKLTTTEKTRHGINPATGKPNAEVPVATPQDVDAAVDAAKEAFKTWSKEPWEKRRDAVLAFADALEKYENDFGKLLTQEQGKPVRRCPI
jgi:acyl-CoA reductase-like NAD-dependent aldehyde dehydrogenase